MKLPNHKEITLHNFDTIETIKNKIAISYDVQPKYLNKFKIPLNLYKETEWPENIKIISLQEAFKNFETKYKNDATFYNFYKYVSPNYDLTPQEFYNIWLNYIYEITEGDEQLLKILNSELNESINNLEKMFPNEFSGLDKKKKEIDYKPSSFLKHSIEKFDSEIKQFEQVKVYDTTEFIQKKQYITVTIQSDKLNYPFEYLFDKIVLTENIPLAIYNEYSKIYKSFVLNGNVPNYENSIVLLYKKSQIEYIQDDENDEDDIEEDGIEEVIYKNTSKLMWYRLYNIVVVRKNDMDNNILIEMDIENNVNVDAIIENLKNVLNWDIDFTTLVTTNKISGEFYALHQVLDSVVTKDVILFNDVLKNFMYSNDNLLAFDLNLSITKSKFHNIIHYIDPITKTKFVCHISTRAANKNDLLKYSTIKIGEPISVFKIIRGANIDVITHFRIMIGKFITIYNNHVKELTDEYSKYVGNVNTKIFIAKKETLTDVMPTIFLEKYSRLCAKQKIPQLIPENDYDENKPSQLEFPKDDDNSKYFECNTEDYPYAGLVVNKLSNSAEYPYLPCCFKLDQKTNPTSNYNKYYKDKDSEQVSGQEYERLLQTQKFAKFGTYGVLPEYIKHLFSILDKNNEYYRRGMHFQNPILGMSSFLECVLDALNWNNILSFGNDEVKRELLIKEERQLIASFIKGNGLCKQECYNLNVNDIELNIADITHYLSPTLYIRALEEFYNVNIFLFQRDTSNPHGNFILPNHEPSSNYIFSPLKSRQTIIIYEHVGGIWDNKYSCELVIRFNPKTLKTITLFNSDDDIVINLYKQLLQMYPNYQNNQLVQPVEPPDVKNITSQYIDNFGKVRYLVYKNIDAIVYCQPLQPFNVPIEKVLPDIKNVNIFVKKYNLQIHGTDAYITKDGFQIFGKMSKTYTNSAINSFVYNKRVSIHLIEYLLYLFSKYIHTNPKSSSKTQVIVDNFLQKHTIINKTGDVNYNINFLVQTNPQMVEIDSLEMRSKLNYMIRVHLLNNRKNIINYHTKNYLENFYNSILDFKEYPNQEIICTKILYTIYNNLYDTKLKMLPPTNYTTELFFLRYDHVNYLAQMTKTLEEALVRVYNWIINKSNTDDLVQEIPAFPFTCIPFSNTNFGIPINVTGGNQISKKEIYIINVYDSKTSYFIPLFEL